MITRRTRGKLINSAQNDFMNLKEELINNEVIDLAADLHGILAATASKYTTDSIVEFVPVSIDLLYRLDASLKANSESQTKIDCLTDENQKLLKAVSEEKARWKTVLEESLISEDSAEQEIKSLKKILQDNLTKVDLLSKEIQSKNAIISILQNDCDELKSKIAGKGLHFDKRNLTQSNSEFQIPKTVSKTTIMSNEVAIPISNRFTLLANETDVSLSPPSTGQKICTVAQVHRTDIPAPSVPTITKTEGPKHKNKSKVIILSDSQGKNIYQHFSDISRTHDLFVLSKPGAKLKHIIEAGKPFIKQLSKGDAVVLLAGSNDINHLDPGVLTVTKGLQALLSFDTDTNIIVHSIPYRYDDPSLNNNIYYANLTISKLVKDYTGSKKLFYGDVNSMLTRSHFTRHGLHYNKMGKKLLARKVCGKLFELFEQPPSRAVSCEVFKKRTAQHESTKKDYLPIPSHALDTSSIAPCPVSQDTTVTCTSVAPTGRESPRAQQDFCGSTSLSDTWSPSLCTQPQDILPQQSGLQVVSTPKAPEMTMDSFPHLKRPQLNKSFLETFSQTRLTLSDSPIKAPPLSSNPSPSII